MKTNAPKRKIFDAVDMLTEEAVAPASMPKRKRLAMVTWRRGVVNVPNL